MSRGPLIALGLLLVGCPSAEPEPEPDPTPAPEAGPCDEVASGDSEQCPAVSCLSIAEERPDATDGDYWLDGGLGLDVALAACDLSGGGWLLVTLQDADGVIVAENAADNPWHKCDDDAAAPYKHVASEDAVVADWSSGSVVWEVDLGHMHPDGGTPYTSRQLDALRAPLTELDPQTRMVATTGDDDNGNWQDGSNGGHEVYVVRGDGDWTVMTPGTNGECGGGGGSWPTAGSRTATYLWATDADDSEVWGDVGNARRPGRLRPEDLLPQFGVLVVATGGGVSFGYEDRVARLR
ncbi:MAG: hypothetical protein KDA24_26700 [Deltaproteobacteria bacterium]|nr:hypothetical protein [Deltaproteobacteria bacterium]